MLTRRELLKTAAAIAVAAPGAVVPSSLEAATQAAANLHGRRGLGAAPAGFGARSRANRNAIPPVDWIDYCQSQGYGGVETGPPPTDPAQIATLRGRIESYNMRIMFDFPLPRTDADVPRYETLVKAAKEIGAFGVHAALTARRYEEFSTSDAFKASFDANKALVARAEPVMRKYKIPLSIENHKGWRSAEQAAWLRSLGSEYVRVHLDFGNNVSLCEDPMETLDNLLPYVLACHIKDMAVAPYEDGFLLSEVPLGDGFLDLKGMVQKLRQKDPAMGFDLEMITRDPLKIPVYTKKYWVTFDDTYSPLPGRDVARIFEILKSNPPAKVLPTTTGFSQAEQLRIEDENNLRSLQWARENLDL